ncbi:DUF2917 domain-containing protein [Caballeronia glathei]|jgi:hypothetical protein|nr:MULTISPECIES: DUF2917 domain-containing protein [Burkholderiaceae]
MMEKASQVSVQAGGKSALASKARVVVYFEVQPRQTLSWRVAHDGELRVHQAAAWLTRHGDPYDYWAKPGDVVRLMRGERVWLSSDADAPLEVSVTSYRHAGTTQLRRWLARLWPRVSKTSASAF